MGNALATRRQVTAHFATLRNAGQAERHRLAADHKYPFVALRDGGQKLLHHHRLGALFVEGLDNAAQIQTVFFDPENAHATHAIQRFEDDVFVLCMKIPDVLG